LSPTYTLISLGLKQDLPCQCIQHQVSRTDNGK